MRTLKEMVQNGQKVRFSHYRNGSLWYHTECGFEFPVPVVRDLELADVSEDSHLLAQVQGLGAKLDAGIGNAVFLNEDKAMLYMRYIRKHLDTVFQNDADD